MSSTAVRPSIGPRVSRPALTRLAPWLAAVATLGVLTAGTLAESLRRNDGRFVYATDDTYIHMAVSAHLAGDGVWGIDGREFTGCSSSPGWTVVLAAAFGLFGVHTGIPMAVAFLSACGVLAVAGRILEHLGTARGTHFGVLQAIVLATPLVTLVFVANEHALHALLILALAWTATVALTAEPHDPLPVARLATLACGAVAVRYESAIVVAIVTALLALRSRWRAAWATAGGGLAAIAAFGLWFQTQGGLFLPNSVVFHARYPNLDLPARVLAFLGPSALSEALTVPVAAVVVLAGGVAWALERRTARPWQPRAVFLGLFVLSAIGHLDVAHAGEFFRYEAYLVAWGTLAVGAVLSKLPQRRLRAGLAVVVGVALAARSGRALLDTPQATVNIDRQQMQFARFVEQRYAGATIAVNDIGALAFQGDARVLDLWGLAHPGVARARMRREYDSDAIRRVVLSEGAEIAIVYERWFEQFGGLPPEWLRVGRWTIRDNVVCGNPTVSFFATTAASYAPLAENWRRFSQQLPSDVLVEPDPP